MKDYFLKILSVFFLVLIGTVVSAQGNTISNEDLAILASQMVNDSLVGDRIEASAKLKDGLIQRLEQPRSTEDEFEELKSVSIKESGDGVFRIFSWQLYVNPDQYKHEAILQFMDGRRSSSIVLLDKSDDIRYADQKELNQDNWFGALYYSIVPFKLKGKMKYLLFGFDGATRTENCKIVDILNIDKKGKISFGAPLFESEVNGSEKITYRHFHQYDQNAKAILRYDITQEIIIYDHLIPWSSKEIGVGLTFVPDGSYEGFEFKKGSWKHIKKVYSHVNEVPITAENPFGKKPKEDKQ